MLTPEVPEQCTNLVKHFEGLKLEAYRCPAGVLTIGWGHTGPDVRGGQSITRLQAEQLLSEDLEKTCQQVRGLVNVPLSDDKLSALTSFTFNLGAGALKKSTLLKKLNANRFEDVPPEFMKWCKATVNGKLVVLNGLLRRRSAEAEMFSGKNDIPMVQAVAEPRDGVSASPKTRSIQVTSGVGAVAVIGTVAQQLEPILPVAQNLIAILSPWVLGVVVLAVVAYFLYTKFKHEPTSV